MSKPLTPLSPAAREAHFKQKIAHQKPLPPSVPPTPEHPPRIVSTFMTKGPKK